MKAVVALTVVPLLLGCKAEFGPNCCIPRAAETGAAHVTQTGSVGRVVQSSAAYRETIADGGFEGLRVRLFTVQSGSDCQVAESTPGITAQELAISSPTGDANLVSGNYGVIDGTAPSAATDGGVLQGFSVPALGDGDDGQVIEGDFNLEGIWSDQISGHFSVHVQRPDGGIYDLIGDFTAPICVVIPPV